MKVIIRITAEHNFHMFHTEHMKVMFRSSAGIVYQVCAACQEKSEKSTFFRRGSECVLMNLMHKESLFKTE